ncbi:gas vesicle protein GvpN [Pseudalkalibacillus sp. SCS-8]|uniref:gas vesicle protein GvpN n=1 Tax=Pseudalkalibacillus nanhaiensis TaxID=3115291 RepID=UPI0032DB3AAD
MTALKERIYKDSRTFIQDRKTNQLISRSLQYLRAGFPVHFTGPTGTGKTSLALELAERRSRPVRLIHGHTELNNKDLIGNYTGYTTKKVIDQYVRSVYKKDETVSESWVDGRLLEAVKNGYTLVYDEFTRSRPVTNNLFLSILEEGVLPLYGVKQTESFCRIHPEFRVIFTSNPEEYSGVYQSPDALLDRMITMYIDYKDIEAEATILTEKFGINKQEAYLISSLTSRLRKNQNGPSIRASMMIARISIEEDIPIDGGNEEFQQLCIDLLCFPISRSIESEDPFSEAEKTILELLNNLK